jgi:hypothetical protein
MSVLARLAGFAGVLALVFAAAAFAGSRVQVDRGEPAGAADGHGDGMQEMAAVDPVRGLAVSENGLTLQLERTTAPRGKQFALAFRITDRSGRTVRDFDVEHTKRMHLIVVRRDMTGFQHLHPVEAADGTWSVPVTLPDAGTYRVFADFATGGKPHTLADDLTVDGTVRTQALPAATDRVDVDGMRVTRSRTSGGELAFSVTRADGTPVAIEDYLGAKGHLVALRRGDLAFLHVHPDADRLRFMAEFPTPGEYRLFLQFKTGGVVHTAAFTQEVQR